MRRRKNETTSAYINRYKLQPTFYQEYLKATNNYSRSDNFTYGVMASLKSLGWEAEYWNWEPKDNHIVEIIKNLGDRDLEVIQFIRKSMKFQIRYKQPISQGDLMMKVHICVGDIAEIKFSTVNTIWIRFK
jgi:hypothetical protein